MVLSRTRKVMNINRNGAADHVKDMKLQSNQHQWNEKSVIQAGWTGRRKSDKVLAKM
jgi:hypothetical protein